MRRPQNLKKSPTCFDTTAVFTQQRQNKWEIFSNFCGLSRKAGLYLCLYEIFILCLIYDLRIRLILGMYYLKIKLKYYCIKMQVHINNFTSEMDPQCKIAWCNNILLKCTTFSLRFASTILSFYFGTCMLKVLEKIWPTIHFFYRTIKM